MSTFQWVKYRKTEGVKYVGINRYEPAKPWGIWSQIMGVVARCEGNHDTFINYDNTGATQGFLQWTFTSGRLQMLLESYKSIPSYGLIEDGEGPVLTNLFEDYYELSPGVQVFEDYGFKISGGKFYSLKDKRALDPSKDKDKKRIVDICMGRLSHPGKPKLQREFAISLAEKLTIPGQSDEIGQAQIEFAKREFKHSLKVVRNNALKSYQTIDNLLRNLWDTPIPAIFFNLWQNSPSGAYSLILSSYSKAARGGRITYLDGMTSHVKDDSKSKGEFLKIFWNSLKESDYANWSYNSSLIKSGATKVPRIVRISKAVEEFYNITLSPK
jgi:hypothetical protein